MKRIKIGKTYIGEGEPVFIIAEAGVNHNGDVKLAKKLVEAAKEAGADAVKFQTFKAENLNTKTAPKASYHIETTGSGQSWFDLLKTQELDEAAHRLLIEHCIKAGIAFLSTPYDEESADMLEKLGVSAFKVASTDANNIPFLRYLAQKRRPIILSTGMCNLKEVREGVEAIREEGCQDLILLHCTTGYPAKLKDANLRTMGVMKNEFNVLVGYSDHTCGYINPVAATSLGAVVYEKHFTLDKTLPGPDHRSSLSIRELKQMVRDIRNTELCLGCSIKRPVKSEAENRLRLRKSVVAKMDIPAGTLIRRKMLTVKRPGTGLAPKNLDSIIGKKAKAFLKQDTIIHIENLE